MVAIMLSSTARTGGGVSKLLIQNAEPVAPTIQPDWENSAEALSGLCECFTYESRTGNARKNMSAAKISEFPGES